jgi:APA family basic amino acid/polyamine antiporter
MHSRTTSTSRELPRAIGTGRATALVVGTIVGASIFVQPSAVSREIPSVAGVVLVWAAAGALTLVGALVTAELASAFPRTGGVYVFLAEAFSPLVGFLWCWAMFWSMHTGIIAALATVCAHYVGYFVPLGGAATRAVAVGVVVAYDAVLAVAVVAVAAAVLLATGCGATPRSAADDVRGSGPATGTAAAGSAPTARSIDATAAGSIDSPVR